MPTNTWTRVGFGNKPWGTAKTFSLITTLIAGQTILRTHVSWGFGGSTSPTIVPSFVASQRLAFGVVTTIGPVGTDQPPDPITQSGDVAPPSQRWLYYEQRGAVIAAWDAGGGVVGWRDHDAQEPVDSKGQLLVPSMAVGSTLNVWFVWNSDTSWDPSGAATAWAYCSMLVRTP